MKHKVFLLLLIISSFTKLNAISYRGFLESSLTWSTNITNNNGDTPGSNNVLSILTTHGIQISRPIFAGIGTGYIRDWCACRHIISGLEGSNAIPIFADCRFDVFFKTFNKIVPWLDFKIGYLVLINNNFPKDVLVGKRYNNEIFAMKEGLFLQVGLGARLKLSSKTGINLGVAGQILPYWKFGKEKINNMDFYTLGKSVPGFYFGITAGFDF